VLNPEVLLKIYKSLKAHLLGDRPKNAEHFSKPSPKAQRAGAPGLNRLFFFILIFSFFFPSCSHKKVFRKSCALKRNASVCIEMPENKLVFENVSSIVYDALWNHFDRVGYKLGEKNNSDYFLKTVVKDVGSSYKFLSPDLLTYAVKMRIKLYCELVDKNDKILAKKESCFRTLVSKAKDYVENSKFFDFEYRRLLERQVYKIDKYFKRFI